MCILWLFYSPISFHEYLISNQCYKLWYIYINWRYRGLQYIQNRCYTGEGGTPSLRVSRYAPRFCPPFSAPGRSFWPPKFDLFTIILRSCWVPFRSPLFSACRRSFCPTKLTKSVISFRSGWVPFVYHEIANQASGALLANFQTNLSFVTY